MFLLAGHLVQKSAQEQEHKQTFAAPWTDISTATKRELARRGDVTDVTDVT